MRCSVQGLSFGHPIFNGDYMGRDIACLEVVEGCCALGAGFLGLGRFMWCQGSRWFGFVVVSTVVRRNHKTNADSHENKNKVRRTSLNFYFLFSPSFLHHLTCKNSGLEPLKAYLTLSHSRQCYLFRPLLRAVFLDAADFDALLDSFGSTALLLSSSSSMASSSSSSPF